MTTAIDQIKAAAVPALIGLILAIGAFLWNQDQGRIADLEHQNNSESQTLATIAANQASAAAERTDFQTSVTGRLDKLQEIVALMGQNLAALTAIQKAAQPQRD